MANRRTQIVDELVRLFKVRLDGESPYITNLFENVKNRQVFWDEISDYPYVCVYAGSEVREYLPGDFKWAFLTVNIRIYVQDEDAKYRIEEIFDDIETVLDDNNTLTVNGTDLCTDIRILSLADDEGVLSPLGVGEITLEVRYGI
jgi:hypothetical protein